MTDKRVDAQRYGSGAAVVNSTSAIVSAIVRQQEFHAEDGTRSCGMRSHGVGEHPERAIDERLLSDSS